MKITAIQIYRLSIPLKTPFKTAVRETQATDDLIVTVECSDGRIGWGGAPSLPAITGETIQSAAAAIQNHIGPRIIGLDPRCLDPLCRAVSTSIAANYTAKAAVDIAIHDVHAQICGLPLYQYLGGARNEIETDVTISVNEPETMAADSLLALREGFSALKVKLGGQRDRDLARISAVREAVGSGIRLRVDANQAWAPKEAVSLIRAMEERRLNIEFVEQPVAARNFDGLKFVTQNVLTPILADESVFSIEDAMRIIHTRAADLINIKLAKSGGISTALRICDLAESAGIACVAGCMLESPVSVAAAAHFAAARGNVHFADLDGPALCKTNPLTGGAIFSGSRIHFSSKAGLGIEAIQGLNPFGGT